MARPCCGSLTPRPDRHPGSGRPLRALLAPLADVRTWRFGLYYVVVFGAYVALSLWLPRYYKRVFGLPLAKAALLTALFIFPASLLRPVGGWLSDKFGARPVTYAVFVAMLLACVPLAAPDGALGFHVGLAQFIALVEVLGIGMGLGKASVYKYIPEYFPNEVGAAGGLVGHAGRARAASSCRSASATSTSRPAAPRAASGSCSPWSSPAWSGCTPSSPTSNARPAANPSPKPASPSPANKKPAHLLARASKASGFTHGRRGFAAPASV